MTYRNSIPSFRPDTMVKMLPTASRPSMSASKNYYAARTPCLQFPRLRKGHATCMTRITSCTFSFLCFRMDVAANRTALVWSTGLTSYRTDIHASMHDIRCFSWQCSTCFHA